MDTFLQTRLPAVLWASLLALVLGLSLLRGHKGPSRGGMGAFLASLVGLVRVLLGLALVALAVLSFLVGRELQAFPILETRHQVALVQVWWTREDSSSMLSIRRMDDPQSARDEMVQIPGRAWAMRAQVIRWPSWASPLGFRPIYRLKDLVVWDYRDPSRQQAIPLTYSLESRWDRVVRYAPLLPGLPPVEECYSRKAQASEGTIYRVVLTPGGLEINEEYTKPPVVAPGGTGG